MSGCPCAACARCAMYAAFDLHLVNLAQTLAVGLEKFAYMSSLAIYVYSSSTFMPLAILAKHDKNLVALTMSPFDGNLLAAATSDCVGEIGLTVLTKFGQAARQYRYMHRHHAYM